MPRGGKWSHQHELTRCSPCQPWLSEGRGINAVLGLCFGPENCGSGLRTHSRLGN